MTAGQVATHRAEFRGAASTLMSYRGPQVVIAGPAGTGKSRAALTKLHLACLKTPNVRCLIVRKTAKSLGSTTLVTFREKVAKEAIWSGAVEFYGGSQQEAAAYRYENGSTIVVGGLDVPEKVLSSEYDIILVDECTEITERSWNVLMSRLRNGVLKFQQIIGCCNPDKPTHWILQRAKKALKLLISVHRDNPAYFTASGELTEAGRSYMGMLDALTGIERARRRDGRWAAAEGVIFEGFDMALHVVPRFEIPQTWARYWAVDFGFIHPFVMQWWAMDPDGRLFMYREMVYTKRLVSDHAERALRCVQDDKGNWTEPKPVAILTDHDAEDRATLEKHLKLKTKPAKKTVSDGLQAVANRFKVQKDGKARLFILEDSLVEVDQELEDAGKPTCLIEEIPGYVWADAKTKEQPVKEDDDCCDTMRYAVAHRDLQTGARADRFF